jgi:hypothetical protein
LCSTPIYVTLNLRKSENIKFQWAVWSLIMDTFWVWSDQALELGTTGRWKEGLVARAAAAAQKKVNLMQLVYGRSPGNSLQEQDDSDESDDDDLFRPRQNSHKVDLVSDYLQPVFWLIL